MTYCTPELLTQGQSLQNNTTDVKIAHMVLNIEAYVASKIKFNIFVLGVAAVVT